MTTCPLCQSVLFAVDAPSVEDSPWGPLEVENGANCRECGYHESYSYGYSARVIGNQVFEWGWDNDINDRMAQADFSRAWFAAQAGQRQLLARAMEVM